MRHGGNDVRLHRLLEIIPGALVWFTFLGGIAFSVAKPLWVIYFIILFDLLWLFRVVYFLIFLTLSWRTYHQSLKKNWLDLLNRSYPEYTEMIHVVFFPMVKEPFEVINASFQSLLQSRYDAKRFLVVLAGEQRAREHFQIVAQALEKKYAGAFFDLLISVHPDAVPGEAATKGANLSFAAQSVKRYADTHHIPYTRMIVSAFDSDTIVHEQYFACLTYTYLSHPHPTRTSYQPVVLYNNTIWQASSLMRLAAFSTTYWLLTELARPDRLFTFSSHSMSFQALVDVGFWDRRIVSEDSRIFLQCFMHYHGSYTVTPLYIPVSMDTVTAPSLGVGLKNLYRQQRRWAWGVENFPYMVEEFLRRPEIRLGEKIKRLWIQIEGMYTWATAPILILLLGRLPLFFLNESDRSTVIAQNAPYILETLLNGTLVGIFILALFSFSLLPPRPTSHSKRTVLMMVLQWLLLPISLVLLSAFPAIDAQTRLMFGRYLGFQVTQKQRVGVSKKDSEPI